MRILVVEDERRLAQALRAILEGEKYMVDTVYDGGDGYDYGQSGIYDAIILDVMLPVMDGFEVAKKLRENKIDTPILMLTARDSIDDKISGLDIGADDYMTKPFEPKELLARIRSVTRRKGEVVIDDLVFGDIRLELSAGELYCGSKMVRLNFKEFEIMKLLMSNPGGTFSKDELIVKVWGYDSDATDNNVEAYISFLRKKLRHIGATVNIEAIRKVGYRLC
ncbi:MAG TPA: response regulator transcription factor [Candidatus Eubacterium pullicola]|nr:response regulator transcription factor [Candidatus Eubacterium pullicola]